MELRILIFGDSITWGAGDPENGGWVTHLRRYIETHGYDSVIRETCTRQGLSFIPMADLPDDSDLADGLHPNPDGYRKMFQRILDFLPDHQYIPKPPNP